MICQRDYVKKDSLKKRELGRIKDFLIIKIPRASQYVSQNNALAFNHLNKQSIRLTMLICIPSIWFCFRYASEIVLLLGGDSFLPSAVALKVFSFAIIINTLSNVFIL